MYLPALIEDYGAENVRVLKEVLFNFSIGDLTIDGQEVQPPPKQPVKRTPKKPKRTPKKAKGTQPPPEK